MEVQEAAQVDIISLCSAALSDVKDEIHNLSAGAVDMAVTMQGQTTHSPDEKRIKLVSRLQRTVIVRMLMMINLARLTFLDFSVMQGNSLLCPGPTTRPSPLGPTY
eukprot:5468093-Ditylum_brightwellii.AAC.1